MVENAVILAAGRGTRMKELTANRPKPLIEINGRPFLDYLLNECRKAGIKRVLLVVGYRKEMIIERYGNQWNGISISYAFQDRLLGTGHALLFAEGFADEFVVMMGDNLYLSQDIMRMEPYSIGVLEVERPELFSTVEGREFVERIVEKPENPRTNVANVGIYGLDSRIFSYIRQLKPSPRGEIELPEAVDRLAKEEKVRIIRLHGWVDMGRKEDVPRVERILSSYDWRNGWVPARI